MDRKQLLLIGVFALAALVAMTQTIAEHVAMTPREATEVQLEAAVRPTPIVPSTVGRRRATCSPAGPGPARGPSCEPRGGPPRPGASLLSINR